MSKRKKIGIVTYWESNDNYGQQLQCWALQHFLRKSGHDAFLIRVRMFTSIPKGNTNVFKSIKLYLKNILIRILILCGGYKIPSIKRIVISMIGKDKAFRQFQFFQEKYIKSTKIYNSYSELFRNAPNADVYIAGSDQIWNADLPQDIWKITFLQFGNSFTKRVAYAPSMSFTIMNNEQINTLSEYLNSFNAISVRENKTVKLLNDIGYKCETVLDPTMLLLANEYTKITKVNHTSPYIFLYTINYSCIDEIPPINDLKKIVGIDNCEIIVTNGSGYTKNEELFNNVSYDYATIPTWLGNIKNANLVVTPSFHGIVFSILFHRNFIFTPLKGSLESGNNRVYTLLNKLGISGHIWGEDELISPIDWSEVDLKLNQQRIDSETYLLNNLK